MSQGDVSGVDRGWEPRIQRLKWRYRDFGGIVGITGGRQSLRNGMAHFLKSVLNQVRVKVAKKRNPIRRDLGSTHRGGFCVFFLPKVQIIKMIFDESFP